VSQKRVYKEGRPDWDDEGKAAAASSDPMATYGRLSVAGFRGDVAETPTGGAGPVERRVATPEELAAARAREAEPSHLVAPGGDIARPSIVITHAGEAAMTQASRQRGAAANRARIAAAKAAPAEEEPAVEPAQEPANIVTTPETEPPRVGLAALADAVVEAMEAEGELEQATELLDQAGVRWQQARAALDAAYRALDEPPPVVESPAEHSDSIPEPSVAEVRHERLLLDPIASVRPTADGGRATAEQLQASRRNGQAAMQAQRRAAELTSAAAAKTRPGPGRTFKRTPEQRETMRVAQLASIARRKAAAAS
jgi:hypothetical protein